MAVQTEEELRKKRARLQISMLLLALPIPGLFTTLRHMLRKKRPTQWK